jgi:subtilisin
MRVFGRLAVLSGIVAIGSTGVFAGASLEAAAEPAVAIIVVGHRGVDSASLAREHAARHGAEVEHVYGAALAGYAARVPANRIADLRADGRVKFISEDRPVWAVDDHAGELPYGVDRIEGEGNTTSSTPAVAVIDTGSGPHSDLNIAGGKNCSTGKSYSDGNGHGTHVAGTIAAKQNGAGVIGVLPGAAIYSVRVLNNSGFGSWSSVICGVNWVTANAAALGIRVANMSLGGSGSDDGDCGKTNEDALHEAICNSVAAGVMYVVAAGNDGSDLKGFVPAAYDEVLTVTAIADFNGEPGGGAAATCRSDVDDTAADFSNYATADDEDHTIAGPGVCIESTWKGRGYKTISGTSMASPHVAGTAALCIATAKCAGTPALIAQKLRADAAARPGSYGFAGDPNSQVNNRYYGHLVYAGGY